MIDIRRVAAALGACLVVGGVTAGCSSSGGSSSTSSSGTSSASAAASGSANAGSVQATAQSLLAPIKKMPTAIPGLIKLDKPPAKGKHIAYITCGPFPQCQVYTPFIQQAATALGWSLRVYQGGATPQANTNVMNQVVQSKPDGIIAVALPKFEVKAQLATLKSQNTPFIDIFDSDPPGDGLTQVIDGQSSLLHDQGAWVAESILALGGSSANTLFVTSTDFPVLIPVGEGFNAEYKKLCSSCGLQTINIAATDIGTPAVNTQIVSFLTSHPSYKYVVPLIADLALGLPAAMSQAGISGISMATANSSPTVLTGIASGSSPWKGGILTPSEIGLAGVNLIVDQMAGKPLTANSYPQPWVDSSNVPSNVQTPVVIPDALQQYKAAWGVS